MEELKELVLGFKITIEDLDEKTNEFKTRFKNFIEDFNRISSSLKPEDIKSEDFRMIYFKTKSLRKIAKIEGIDVPEVIDLIH